MLFREAAMPYLSFADLVRHRVPLSAPEAVALTLAAARVLDARRGPGGALRLPGDEEIFLNNSGDVTLGRVSPSTEQEEIAALASLLRRLLQLDTPDRDRRGRVPGGLLVLLARALHQIDLAAPRRDEFIGAIIRFGGGSLPDAAALAVIFWRAAGLRPALVPKATPLALPSPVRVEQRRDRRLNGPTRADLRRALRDLERQLYEREHAAPVRRRDGQPAVAAAIIGAMLSAMLAGGLLRPAPEGMATRGTDPAAVPASEPAPDQEPAMREIVDRSAADPAPFAVSSPRSVPLVTHAALGRDAFSPSFDPTGQTLYFHAGRTAAPLMRAAVAPSGSIAGITTLLDDGWSNYHVTMSPDGRMLAFDSDRDGLRGVYIADARGRHPRRVSGNGYGAVPSWSPDGRRLTFVRSEPWNASVWNVWVADVAAGTLRRVTQHRTGQTWGASWFPDGRRVAYSHETQLVIADLQTGRTTVIASPRPGHLVRTPAVSPDGSRVVFQVHGDGAWMLDVERMRLRRVLPDPSAEEFVWSPNGRSVAFHARTREGWGVWRMDL